MTGATSGGDWTTCAPVELKAELHQVFGTPFSIWQLATGGDPAPAELAAWLNELAEGRCVEVVEHVGASQVQLGIPLTADNKLVAVTTAIVPDMSATQLLQIGEVFRREFDQRHSLATLRKENDAFLQQMTDDFEELTFLRKMAKLLETSDASMPALEMARALLPSLRPQLRADTLVLLLGADPKAGRHLTSPHVALWHGKQDVDPAVALQLVERYRAECEATTVVRNDVDELHRRDFPGVAGFLMVSIVKAGSVAGWLLALNRNNDGLPSIEQAPWGISCYEFGTHEAGLTESAAATLATHWRHVDQCRARDRLLVNTVRTLVSALDAKDEYTRGHSERVALIAKRLAQELGIDEDRCDEIYFAGLLHDVGKIGIADDILKKEAHLTDDEYDAIKQHPEKGWLILHEVAELKDVLPGVLHHHEGYDGRGYPDRLTGDEIPLAARIIAVAESYDAMTSERPYREALSRDAAEQTLREGAGAQWDPAIVEALFRALPDLARITADSLAFAPRRPEHCLEPIPAQ